MRWKFAGGSSRSMHSRLPSLFSFDHSAILQVGTLRLRGIEFAQRSFRQAAVGGGCSGDQPRAIASRVGERPGHALSLCGSISITTDIFGGLTPTATLSHTGARAVSAEPQASLGGKKLMVPGYNTLDLRLRQSFKLGKVPMSFPRGGG
jgi:hypothetical protein